MERMSFYFAKECNTRFPLVSKVGLLFAPPGILFFPHTNDSQYIISGTFGGINNRFTMTAAANKD